MEQPIFKDCGKSFIPLIAEVLVRLPKKEREWTKANVRFTQRLVCQNSLDHLCQVMVNETYSETFRRNVAAEFHSLWADINEPVGMTWKHGRYHYVRLNAKILDQDPERALFTIAHELGHCFDWKPIRERDKEGREERERVADEWASKRGFTRRN